jgi:hypothetical protein
LTPAGNGGVFYCRKRRRKGEPPVKAVCPRCQNELRKQAEKRYLSGDYIRERYQTRHSELYKYHCLGRLGCQHKFIVRIDKPVDEALADTVSLCYDFGLYNQALKSKPGVVQLGTTVGDFTNVAHLDTAAVWRKVLGYFSTQGQAAVL